MVVTRKWLEEFVDLKGISTEEIVETLNKIGQEVEDYRRVEVPRNVVIGEVIECDRHPNAKRLSLCKVKIGEEKVLPIVCGAPNIGVGQMVPVALPGAKLPNGLEIAKATIRGAESFGMVCSSEELGLPPIGEGILELDNSLGKLELGKEVYHYLNDEVIDIAVTPNRGDALSVYGIARELAAAFGRRLHKIEPRYKELPEGIGRVVTVNRKEIKYSSHLVKAIEGRIEASVKVRLRLALCGVEAKRESEKVLKYAIHGTGVLLVMANRGGIQFKNVDGIDLFQAPYGDYYVGIRNELEYEENGRYIVDASYVDPTLISELVYNKKIADVDDYFYRASRGSEVDLQMGLTYFLNEAGVHVFTGELNFIREDIDRRRLINVHLQEIWELIGCKIPERDIVNILKRLGFELQGWGDTIRLKVPPYRKDIQNGQDVAEEILRIYGIDLIESRPLKFVEKNRINKNMEEWEFFQKIRQRAVSQGLYEVVHFAFEERERLEKYKLPVVKEELDLLNPIVKELDTLRTTHLLQLLDDVALNRANGYKRIPLFTIGTIFDEERRERVQLAIMLHGERESQSPVNSGKPPSFDFPAAVEVVAGIIGEFELKPASHPLAHPYQVAKIVKGGEEIGFIGKVHPKVTKEWKVGGCYFAEIELEKLSLQIPETEPIIPYPVVTRDLSVVVEKGVNFEAVAEMIEELKLPLLKEFYPIDIFDLREKNSLTIRFKLQAPDRTLTEEEINGVMETILERLRREGIELR